MLFVLLGWISYVVVRLRCVFSCYFDADLYIETIIMIAKHSGVALCTRALISLHLLVQIPLCHGQRSDGAAIQVDVQLTIAVYLPY